MSPEQERVVGYDLDEIEERKWSMFNHRVTEDCTRYIEMMVKIDWFEDGIDEDDIESIKYSIKGIVDSHRSIVKENG